MPLPVRALRLTLGLGFGALLADGLAPEAPNFEARRTALGADDACAQASPQGGGRAELRCALGAVQLKAQLTSRGSFSARDDAAEAPRPLDLAWDGVRCNSSYAQAKKLWLELGEQVPAFVEGPAINFTDSHERVTYVVPIVGGILLACCVVALLVSRSWLAGCTAKTREEEAGENAALHEGQRRHIAGAQEATLLNDGEIVTSGVSTRTPSEREADPAGGPGGALLANLPRDPSHSGSEGEKIGKDDKDLGSIKLFRFAAPTDKVFFGIALTFSSIHGATMPMAFFFCDVIFKSLNLPNDDGTIPPTVGPHSNRDEATWGIARIYLILAIVAFIARSVAVVLCAIASDRMVFELRKAFLHKLLQQGPAWHDLHSATEMSARLAQDAYLFREGTGDHLITAFRAVAMFWSAILLSFYKDWQMALVMVIALPIAGFATATSFGLIREFTKAQGYFYINAGGIAESALQSIRNVAAFNGQKKTVAAYEEKLREAEGKGIQMGAVQGFCGGTTLGVINFAMSIGLYAGSQWLLSGFEEECWVSDPPFGVCRTGGSILSSMFTVMWGFTAGLGSLALSVESIAQCRSAAQRLYEVIDAPLAVDFSNYGKSLSQVDGAIEFENVRFSYPGRQNDTALYSMSVKIDAGTKVAFVGPSGSGKSTMVSLLLRFYEPQAGRILLDGNDVSGLQLIWYRSRLSLVEQEPVLFACSVSENIAFGSDRLVGKDEIQRAAKMANAHDFIERFPQGYDTLCGERGAQLSGGQKQRIAIARALIRDPAVLLLDEATSALDTHSEEVVQDALDKLLTSKQRTTLIIAHRLSTVKAADKICVMQAGQLVESGKHADLIKGDTLYSHLVKSQMSALETSDSDNSGAVDKAGLAVEVAAEAPVDMGMSAKSSLAMTPSMTRQTSGGSTTGKHHVAALPGDAQPLEQVPLSRLWSMSKPEFGLYGLGICSTLVGAFMAPLSFMRFAQTINVFNTPPVVLDPVLGEWVRDYDESFISSTVSSMCFTMQVIGVIGIACSTISNWAFHKAGEKLTTRLRIKSLESCMRQEIGWFDLMTSSALAQRLQKDVPAIRGLVGFSLASLCQATLLVTSSMGMALYFSWRFTICIVAICPMLAIGGLATAYSLEKKDEDATGALVSESIGSIKTIAAFGLQGRMLARFTYLQKKDRQSEYAVRFYNGVGTGISSAALFLMYCLTVVFGTIFIDQGVMAPDKAALSLFMLLGCTAAFSEIVRWVERSKEARKAADEIFHLIDRSPTIDSGSEEGAKPDKLEGRIEFRDVHFWYPTRPDVRVFRGFTLSIEPNTTVAMVGHSGSGKSTIISLLQRFYDVQRGSVALDGREIKELNVRWLRSQMGLVQQEPVLVSGTILENIRYGDANASEESVIEAAKLANAHAFVSALPNQYDTDVGFARNSQLSGGQKQRIAIARALIRDPNVLLLDEATSALDTASERVVQEALDSLLSAKRRTTIVVAHRLSTIRGADQICVVHHGKIVEQGRHEELLANPGGQYAKLVGRQLEPAQFPPPRISADKAEA